MMYTICRSCLWEPVDHMTKLYIYRFLKLNLRATSVDTLSDLLESFREKILKLHVYECYTEKA